MVPPQDSRLAILDSLRAIAALFVILFHYLFRWTPANGESLLPALPYLAPAAEGGWIGVELFFLISGFVITLTLAKTHGPVDFGIKRFARLAPPMLVVSTITFFVVRGLAVAPFNNVALVDFVPSLLFVEPYVVNKITGLHTNFISDVYWSLAVEVKFYVCIALLHFFQPRRLLINLTALIVAATAMAALSSRTEALLHHVFFVPYAPFFLAGVAFHDTHRDGLRAANVAVIGISYALALLAFRHQGLWVAAGISALFLVFGAFVSKSPMVEFLRWKPLTTLGAASYSLYLAHEAIGVPLIVKLSPVLYGFLVTTIVVTLSVAALSMALHVYVEVPARRKILQLFASITSRAQGEELGNRAGKTGTTSPPRNVSASDSNRDH